MSHKIFILQTLLVLTITFLILGKNYEHTSQYLSSNSGLINNEVLCGTIDKDGKKWFGTKGGVSVLDGTNWTSYTSENSGLVLNHILSMCIDSEGKKWFGALWGVSVLDGTNWTTYTTSNSGLLDNRINCIVSDTLGNIWFATNKGVNIFDGFSWRSYTTENSGLLDDLIYSIAIDKDGTKWFGTGKGISSFDGSHWTTYDRNNSDIGKQHSVYKEDRVDFISIEKDGTKWASNNYALLTFKNNTWVRKNSENEIAIDIKQCIAKDGYNRYWTDYIGLNRITGMENELSNKPVSYYESTNTVTDIFVDSNDLIWLCTKTGVISSDEGIKDFYFNKSIKYIDDFFPIDTELGTFHNPNIEVFYPKGKHATALANETKYKIVTGGENFKLSKPYGTPSLLIKQNITTEDDSAKLSIEVQKMHFIDTFDIVLPYRRWTTTEDTSAYMNVEVPKVQCNFIYPERKDVTLPVHLRPINGFTSTTTIHATNSSSDSVDVIVPEDGYYTELIIAKDSLKYGKNKITVTASNSGIILGKAEVVVDIGGAFTLSDTTFWGDTLGDTHDFSVKLSDYGIAYFDNEPIVIKKYSSNYSIATGTNTSSLSYDDYDWFVIDATTKDTIYQRSFNGDFNNNEVFQFPVIPFRTYEFMAVGASATNLKYVTFSPDCDDFNINLGSIGATGSKNQHSVEFKPITPLISIDTITTDELSEVTLTAQSANTAETFIFSSLSSEKTLVSPILNLVLPYKIDTIISVTPALTSLSSGKVDTTNDYLWVMDSDSNQIYFHINGNWISKKISGKITHTEIAPNKTIWIGTSKGLYSLTDTDTLWKHHTNLSGTNVQKLIIDTLNNIFVYTTEWDKYSEPFWTKGISLSEVPSDGFESTVPIRKGLSEVPQTYGFINKEIVQFRLGKKEDISIIESKNDYKLSNKFMVIPNPVNIYESSVNIVIPEENTGYWNIKIFDALGDVIDEAIFKADGKTNYMWNLKNKYGKKVTAGSYLLIACFSDSNNKNYTYRQMIGVKK